jgi:acyl-CoA thioester hydrolase
MAGQLPDGAAEYGCIEPVYVHFDDLDSMGMVHNSRYAVMVEHALTIFWDQRGYTYKNGVPAHQDAFNALAEYSISYKAPVTSTGEILIHFWVDGLSKSSVTYGFRVLSVDRGTVHATGHRVQIRLDMQTLRPTTWGDDTLAIYESLRPAALA